LILVLRVVGDKPVTSRPRSSPRAHARAWESLGRALETDVSGLSNPKVGVGRLPLVYLRRTGHKSGVEVGGVADGDGDVPLH